MISVRVVASRCIYSSRLPHRYIREPSDRRRVLACRFIQLPVQDKVLSQESRLMHHGRRNHLCFYRRRTWSFSTAELYLFGTPLIWSRSYFHVHINVALQARRMFSGSFYDEFCNWDYVAKISMHALRLVVTNRSRVWVEETVTHTCPFRTKSVH